MAKGITELIRDFKELHPRAYERIRAGVLDEFLKELYPCKYKHNDDCSLCKGIRYCLVFEAERIAEQMKEQRND